MSARNCPCSLVQVRKCQFNVQSFILNPELQLAARALNPCRLGSVEQEFQIGALKSRSHNEFRINVTQTTRAAHAILQSARSNLNQTLRIDARLCSRTFIAIHQDACCRFCSNTCLHARCTLTTRTRSFASSSLASNWESFHLSQFLWLFLWLILSCPFSVAPDQPRTQLRRKNTRVDGLFA